MRTIKAEELTIEKFHEFGEFYSYTEPTGNTLGTFFQDHIKMPVSGNMQLGFSSMIISKPEKMIVSVVEYHNTTSEVIVALDDDVVIHCAPASKAVCPEKTKAFILPKGSAVRFNVGVWHKAPYAKNKDRAHLLIVLPERVYSTDCNVVEYSEDEQFEITL